MKLSQIFGLQAISKDGKMSGYVVAVVRLGDEVLGFVCSDERETEFFAGGKDATIRGDKLCFKASGKVPKSGKKIRLGYPVYSHRGKFLGHAEDFILNDGKIVYMIIGKKKYAFDGLEIGDAVIVGDARAKTEVVAKDMLIGTVLSMQN